MYLCTTISMSEGISISMLVTFLMPIWLASIFSRLKKKGKPRTGCTKNPIFISSKLYFITVYSKKGTPLFSSGT